MQHEHHDECQHRADEQAEHTAPVAGHERAHEQTAHDHCDHGHGERHERDNKGHQQAERQHTVRERPATRATRRERCRADEAAEPAEQPRRRAEDDEHRQ